MQYKKKRSLCARRFFEEFPKVALGKLLLVVYVFAREDSRRRISRHLGLNASLASNICRKLQDVCSRDLEGRPFKPFGGPGMVVKCEESKFNHKPKVKPSCPYFPQSQKCFSLFFWKIKQIVLKSVRLFKNVKQTTAANIMIKRILLLT